MLNLKNPDHRLIAQNKLKLIKELLEAQPKDGDTDESVFISIQDICNEAEWEAAKVTV
jgi:hypothetical protein